MDSIQVYAQAIELARINNQTVGENNDYFITLEQLERLLMKQRE
jgi:hypothetical protein